MVNAGQLKQGIIDSTSAPSGLATFNVSQRKNSNHSYSTGYGVVDAKNSAVGQKTIVAPPGTITRGGSDKRAAVGMAIAGVASLGVAAFIQNK